MKEGYAITICIFSSLLSLVSSSLFLVPSLFSTGGGSDSTGASWKGLQQAS